MTKVIAHRGASFAAPENTLAAVKLAWEMGVDGVEVDVRLTGDGQVVVIHDASTDRTSPEPVVVRETTLAHLQKLGSGRQHRNAAYRTEPFPALRQVLETVPPGKLLLIELKEGLELLDPLLADIRTSEVSPREIVLIGFNLGLMTEAKRRAPELTVLLLYGDYDVLPPQEWPGLKNMLIAQALAAGLDGLDLRAPHPAMDAAFIDQIHAANLQAYVWTVNDPRNARLLMRTTLDGLTTDVPDWVMAVRDTLE